MEKMNVYALIMIVIIVSFMGFCVENMCRAYTKGYIDNRNMCLPFLLGYGISCLLVYFLFGLPQKPLFFSVRISMQNPAYEKIYYYIMLILFISLGEVILGTLVEKISGYQWWNYSRIPLHITKYTSIPTSVGYSLIVFLFMRYCFEPLYIFLNELNSDMLIVVSLIGIAVLSYDMFYNLYLICKNGEGNIRWRVDLKKK